MSPHCEASHMTHDRHLRSGTGKLKIGGARWWSCDWADETWWRWLSCVSWWFVRQRKTPEAVSMVTELFHKQFNIWEMSRVRSPSALRNISEEMGKTLRFKLKGGVVENVFSLKHGCSVSGALDWGCVFFSTFTCIRVWSWICFSGTLWGGCLLSE